ncbi:C3 and PZP-like alpha-2-macroglobulin domain-containing protein 8 isoform X2 [Zerene cesonia]|uniref:C3 and PZP-like alpha-2-macroglobulin domain-containing protein 8 isoform X2 n=1 Tax=Zerene cesonia TaxID=33412 RepID=UPI0018E503DB|nr:C3 and PZP-like alpha-2-macroglobulin domain-containing protein 8 isoform X2 [Zerene cesonia]
MILLRILMNTVVAILSTSSIVQCVSVLGPRLLRPHSSYKVSIAGGSRAHNLYVAVEGKRSTGEQFTQGREVQIPAATSKLINIEINDPGPGKYKLVARSTSGPQFSSSAPLVYQPRSFCIFVQTDKKAYQPGDTLNFRVIALDKYLLPLSNAVDISILDTGGSPVRQWAGVPLDRGVFSGELVLADEPALGQWTVQVEVRGQTYSKHIMIADYVLPKFQMDMDIPKEVLFSEGAFNINLTANHFNGLPVTGELTISAYAVFFSNLLQPVFSNPARKVINFNGNAIVPFNLKTDLDLAEDAARPLVVEAVLEEKDTLIKQNVSARILLLRTPYRLKITAPDYFKPRLPFNVQIELVNSTGHTLDVSDDVSVERLWDDGAPVNVTNIALKNGVAMYSITPDIAHTNSTLNIVVKYKEVSERIVNVQKSLSPGGQYLTLEVLSSHTSVDDKIHAKIVATEAMDIIHYVVIGRGDIVVAKTLELNPPLRAIDITIPVSSAMSPGCTLLAWYPRLDPADRLLAAAVYVPNDKLLQNKVSVTPVSSSSVFRPNGLVEFRVTGEPGSQAALLGADVKAIASGLADPLGSGLDMHTIEREVESFIGIKHSIFKNEDTLPGMGFDLGGRSTADVFHNAGVVILTDGIVTSNVQAEAPETGTRAPSAGPYAFSRVPAPPSPRLHLAASPHNTWMFNNLSIGDDGKGSRESWSPLTPGSWSVGAFAVHPTLGLGLASPQQFTTTVPLTITAELPESLQKGETLAAIVTLKNSLAVDTSIEVTFHNSDQYFDFEPLENTIDSTKKIELFRRLRVTVPARGSTSTAFLVSVVRVGEAPVIVEATGNGVSASLFRTIDVKDGYEEEVWSWSLLDARRGVARANVSLSPALGTRVAAVSLEAAGDLIANSFRALKSPAIVAADAAYALRPLARACILLDYLQVTEQGDEITISKEARAQASFGYQRLMAFRKPDGSFSQETGEDAESDVFMTATAARWLSRSSRYVAVSPAAGGAARWLAAAQAADGAWPAPPASPAPSAPSAPRRNAPALRTYALTAHALIALLDTKGSEVLYKNAINKGVDYIARHLSGELDAQALALAAAALAAARHPQATRAIELMDQYANTTASTLFWSRKLPGSEWRNPWLKGNSLEASTAAWALRAMLNSRLVEEGVPVARYLLQALDPRDQDPDVLDALAQFAEAIKTSTKLRVAVNVTGFEEPRQFNIDSDNALIIQTQLIRNIRSASAITEGRGLAVLGLSAKGSTNVTAAWPRYTLDPRVDQVSTKDRLQLSICIGFVPVGNETESGLTLLTVQLPSGYLADINTITELTAARHVVGARLRAGGARVVAWLRAARAERCATLAAPRALPVARQRPGWATLMDLYDSSHRARMFFRAVSSSACDVCRAWASCARACGSLAPQRAPSPAAPASPASPDTAHAHSPALTVILPLALALAMRCYVL